MKARKTPIASFYANLLTFEGYYEKKWFPYTMPISDIYGLRAAFDLIENDVTHLERHAKIGAATRKAITSCGLKLHLKNGYSNTVTVFDVPPQTTADAILHLMREEHNILIAGSFDTLAGKVIRIGHMGANANKADMVETLHALYRVLCKLGVPVTCDPADVFLAEL